MMENFLSSDLARGSRDNFLSSKPRRTSFIKNAVDALRKSGLVYLMYSTAVRGKRIKTAYFSYNVGVLLHCSFIRLPNFQPKLVCCNHTRLEISTTFTFLLSFNQVE